MDELLKKLSAKSKTGLAAMSARYFDRFRIAEFKTLISIVTAGTAYVFISAGISVVYSAYLAAGFGLVAAYLFIRNPKMADWVQENIQVERETVETKKTVSVESAE